MRLPTIASDQHATFIRLANVMPVHPKAQYTPTEWPRLRHFSLCRMPRPAKPTAKSLLPRRKRPASPEKLPRTKVPRPCRRAILFLVCAGYITKQSARRQSGRDNPMIRLDQSASPGQAGTSRQIRPNQRRNYTNGQGRHKQRSGGRLWSISISAAARSVHKSSK